MFVLLLNPFRADCWSCFIAISFTDCYSCLVPSGLFLQNYLL